MSNELAIVKKESFAVLSMDGNEVREIIAENLGENGKIEVHELPRIKIPSGGTTQWIGTGLSGEESYPAIEGIIIHHKDQKIMWLKSIDDGGSDSPPDCSSPDGMIGFPNEEAKKTGITGDCATCPFNQFGSDIKDGKIGRGKRCKDTKALFIMKKDSVLPSVVMLPPTSKSNAKSFLLALAGAGKRFYEVVTKITLEKAKSKDNITYAKAKFITTGTVDPKLIPEIKKFRELIVGTVTTETV